MDAFTERGMMTSAGGEERTRFFRSLGLDPPFLSPRHHHRGVKNSRLRPWLEFADGGHLQFRHES